MKAKQEKALKMMHDKLRGGSAIATTKDIIIKGSGELIDSYEGSFIDDDIMCHRIEVAIYSKDNEEVLTMTADGNEKPFESEHEALEVAQMIIGDPEKYLKIGNY